MGTRISSIGFSSIDLQDLMDLVLYCSQEKKVCSRNSNVRNILYKWNMEEGASVAAVIQEMIGKENKSIFVKNIFPVFEKNNLVDLTIQEVQRDEHTAEVVVHGKLLYIPCTLHLCNAYEISIKALRRKKSTKVSLTALGYYGKVKEERITPEDVEDGIQDLLESEGCLYPAYSEEDTDNHDYFVHGLIKEYRSVTNPYTEENLVYVLLDIGVIDLPILLNEKDLEEIDNLEVGKYFEGICWLQGQIPVKSKGFAEHSDISDIENKGEDVEVIAVENAAEEMRQHWNDNVHFLVSKPVHSIVKLEGQYYEYNPEGKIDSVLTVEEMNRYVEDKGYIWAQFTISKGDILSQIDTGKIYVNGIPSHEHVGKQQYPYHYIKLGKIMYKNEEYDKAIQYYTKALEINENILEGYLYRAVAQEALQEWQKAIRDYKRFLSVRPKDRTILERVDELKQIL